MFKILNYNAISINGSLVISGNQDGTGYKQVKVGSILTDGENQYVITGIPFVNYKTIDAMKKNISLEIRNDGFSLDTLAGKTLELVS